MRTENEDSDAVEEIGELASQFETWFRWAMIYEVYDQHQNVLNDLYLHIEHGTLERIERAINRTLRKRVDINCFFYDRWSDYGKLILCQAVYREEEAIQIISILINRLGANINMQDGKGNTPLHYACYRRNRPLVRFLFNQHADWTIENNDHRTPLYETGSHHMREYIRRLINLQVNRRCQCYIWLKSVWISL